MSRKQGGNSHAVEPMDTGITEVALEADAAEDERGLLEPGAAGQPDDLRQRRSSRPRRGYSPEEAVGRNCRFLQAPAPTRTRSRAIRQALKPEDPLTIDILNYRKDGHAVHEPPAPPPDLRHRRHDSCSCRRTEPRLAPRQGSEPACKSQKHEAPKARYVQGDKHREACAAA